MKNKFSIVKNWMLMVLVLWCVVACSVNSDEVDSSVNKVMLKGVIVETKGESTAGMNVRLVANHDFWGNMFMKLVQGEEFTIQSFSENEAIGLSSNLNSKSPENTSFLDSIEVDPATNNTFEIKYVDSDNKVAKHTVQSRGYSRLLLPQEDQDILREEPLLISWEKRDYDEVKITLAVDAKEGKPAMVIYSLDTGFLQLKPLAELFADKTITNLTISLTGKSIIHETESTDYKAVNVTLSSNIPDSAFDVE